MNCSDLLNVDKVHLVKTDVLVVGGGAAGCFTSEWDLFNRVKTYSITNVVVSDLACNSGSIMDCFQYFARFHTISDEIKFAEPTLQFFDDD